MRCEDGSFGRAVVPSGASAGKREALELRDGDGNRYAGKGVLRAVRNVRDETAPATLGLDGTETKLRLGTNPVRAHQGAASGKSRFSATSGARLRSHLPVPPMNNRKRGRALPKDHKRKGRRDRRTPLSGTRNGPDDPKLSSRGAVRAVVRSETGFPSPRPAFAKSEISSLNDAGRLSPTKTLREDTTSQQNRSPRNRLVPPRRCRARQKKASLYQRCSPDFLLMRPNPRPASINGGNVPRSTPPPFQENSRSYFTPPPW